MELQTIVKMDRPAFQLDYSTRLLLLGSCFVENIGAKLAYYKFKVDLNPCGIVYNPMSVADTLEWLLSGRYFTPEDLLYNDHKWVSLSHHGRFSSPDQEQCLHQINTRLEEARRHLREADVLILTWGTAWVYRHLATGRVVANCHKFPAADFERFRLQVEEIVRVYVDLLNRLRKWRPELKVLFTVSPIRHWKDGAHGNQLSKAVLLLAIERLTECLEQVFYFPSYEIVMDELRDYRFYADDMLHISSQGIEYIWDKFRTLYMTADTLSWMKRIEQVNKNLAHRPADPEAPAYRELMQRTSREQELIERELRISFS